MTHGSNSDFTYFRFKKLDSGEYLLTNDVGNHLFVGPEDFQTLRDAPDRISPSLQEKMVAGGFIAEPAGQQELVDRYRKHYDVLDQGTCLHIVVLTLRCDHGCLYCQASRQGLQTQGCDMDRGTAEQVVDFCLQSPARHLGIEFQGGEPLLNFDVLQHLVTYARGRDAQRRVAFSVVTNLSVMDDAKLQFLQDEQVGICTSLDGPKEVHNASRILAGGDSFERTVHWLRRIADANRQLDAAQQRFSRPNALLTVTRAVFPEYRRMVDLYVELGLRAIHLRPISPFGHGRKPDRRTGYTPEEFLQFYDRTLDYIIGLNRAGTKLCEKTAQIFLHKILRHQDPGFMDIRSPCGAGIGQLAYNHDGSVFPCDEARMLHATGDSIFRLGHVATNSYKEIMRSATVRDLCLASCLEGLPGCNDCAYNPYCGVCPVGNYATQGSIFGQMPTNDRCLIHMGIQDILFARLRQDGDVFASWLDIV